MCTFLAPPTKKIVKAKHPRGGGGGGGEGGGSGGHNICGRETISASRVRPGGLN